MPDRRISPTFTSARGTIAEWSDPERDRAAFAHHARLYYEHHIAYEESMRAQFPDWDERTRRLREAIPPPDPVLLPPPGMDVIRFEQPLSPDVPDVWEPLSSVHQVRVLPPDSSITVTLDRRGADLAPIGRKIVNPYSYVLQPLGEAPRMPELVHSNPGRDCNDLNGYCSGPHPFEALTLLEPRCFFHGRDQHGDVPSETTVLGRAAEVVRLRRIIPLTDPRIMGDDRNPVILDEAEEIEVVVDRERGVILEWRGLFDGQVYARHYFTEIHFDEPMDEADFSPESQAGP